MQSLQPTRFLHLQTLNAEKALAFHTLRFQFVTLDKRDGDCLTSGNISSISPAARTKLVKSGILVHGAAADQTLLEAAFSAQSAKNQNNAVSYLVYLTDKCNLRCKYCFQENLLHQERRQLKLHPEMVDSVVSAIESIHTLFATKDTGKHVVLFGGEPFLPGNAESLRKLLPEIAKLQKVGVEAISNGTFIHRHEQLLLDHSDILRTFTFTVNGTPLVHNTIKGSRGDHFQDLIRAIDFVLNKLPKCKVRLNFLIDSENKDEISPTLDCLESLGLLFHPRVEFSFGRVQSRLDPVNGKYQKELPLEDYIPLLLKTTRQDPRLSSKDITGSEVSFLGQFIRAWESGSSVLPRLSGCRAITPGRFCLYPDGAIYPCTELAGLSETSVGTFFPKFSMNKGIQMWRNYSPMSQERCSSCRYIGICSGGCPASNHGVHGCMSKCYCMDFDKILRTFFQSMYDEGMLE